MSAKVGWGPEKTDSLLQSINLDVGEFRCPLAKAGGWFLCVRTKLKLQAENLSQDTCKLILSTWCSFFPRLAAKRGKSWMSGREISGASLGRWWEGEWQVSARGPWCMPVTVPSPGEVSLSPSIPALLEHRRRDEVCSRGTGMLPAWRLSVLPIWELLFILSQLCFGTKKKGREEFYPAGFQGSQAGWGPRIKSRRWSPGLPLLLWLSWPWDGPTLALPLISWCWVLSYRGAQAAWIKRYQLLGLQRILLK